VLVYDPGGNLTRIRAVGAFEVLAAQLTDTGVPVRINLDRSAVSIHIWRNATLPRRSGGGAKSLDKFSDGSFFLLH
jgi:hypothetical protein